MKYYDIKQKLESITIFSSKDIFLIDPAFRLPTLYDWEAKGLVKKIRNNNYVFADYAPADKDYYFISNKLYEPSYISLETALNHYGVIPEIVQEVTAITTNKTNRFETIFGNFSYASVGESLFFGYNMLEHNNHGVAIASMEKTVADYLYLKSNITETADFEGLRWNREVLTRNLNFETFEKYLIIFDNKALQKRCVSFMEYLNA
jgi:predicted transcriptional regulator of viral defense system